jgi:hypothetical protein
MLNFNDETSNVKKHPLKSLRVEHKEHPSKILIVESQKLKLTNIPLFFEKKKKLRFSYLIGS